MPHDQVVHPRHIIEALGVLDRAGNGRCLADLESREPQMASYMMEHLSILHGALMELGGPAKRTQRLYQRIEALLLVCLQAQRNAHRELWDLEPFSPEPQTEIPPYLIAATSGCPLCGSPHLGDGNVSLLTPLTCSRTFRCTACGSRWSLHYQLAALVPGSIQR